MLDLSTVVFELLCRERTVPDWYRLADVVYVCVCGQASY